MNEAADSRVSIGVKECGVVLILAVLVLLVQAGLALFERRHGGDAEMRADVSMLSAQARQLGRQGREGWEQASAGQELRAIRMQMSARVQRLAAYPAGSISPNALAMVVAAWAEVEAAAGQLDARQSEYTAMLADLAQCLEQAETVREGLDALVREMIASGSAASQVYLALHQLVLVNEMVQPLEIVRAGGHFDGKGAVGGMAELAGEIAIFERVLAGLHHGDAEMALIRLRNRRALVALGQAQAQWEQWRPALERAMQQAPTLPAMHTAALELERTVEALLVALSELTKSSMPRNGLWIRMLAGVLALLSATGLWLASVQERRRWREHVAAMRHRDREALARLLDEMGALAEGDLSVQVTASSAPVGVLAEAVNFAVEQLAARVQAMTAAMERIAGQAEQARLVALERSEVGHYQLQELDTASERMEGVITSANALLAQSAGSDDAATRIRNDAARHCADRAADVAAMIATLHTVSARMQGEDARALQALEALAQAVEELRQSAAAFVLPQ